MRKKIQKTIKRFRNRGRKRDITGTAALRKIERRYQVVNLRRDGLTTKEIADTLNVSVSVVMSDLRDLLSQTVAETNETVEESRQIQLLRLDQLIKTYTRYATEVHKETRFSNSGQEFIIEVPPNPKYAELILKVEERRSKLLALDTPETKKLDVTGVREYIGVDLNQV